MEILGLLWIPDFIPWILAIVLVFYVYGTYPYKTMAAYGYTGPKPKAFIGNMDLIFQTGHFGSWDLTGKKLYGKVFTMYEGRNPTIVVFDDDMLKQIMVKDFSSFEDRREMNFRGPIISHSLIDITGAHWKRVRTLTTPFFTTMKLKQNIPLLNFCTNNLLSKCEQFAERKEQLDVKEIIGAFTLEAICLTAFGIQVDSQNDPDHILLTTVKKMMKINMNYWGYWVGFAFPSLMPLFDRMGCESWPKGSVDLLAKFTRDIMQERKNTKEERADFIQTMMKAHEVELELEAAGVTADEAKKWKALTEVEIIAQAALFILGGYDTTSTAISFLLFNIANNPDCQERVLREINDVIPDGDVSYENLKQLTYLDMCFEESQRIFPSAFRSDRRCLKDTTVKGYFIPRDTLVIIPIYGLHHDPDYWPDPEKFNPERFSPENRSKISTYAYQAFGIGPRNCIGMRLAQIEVKMAVVKIVQRFKLKIGQKMEMPIKLANDFFPKAVGGIWLDAEKR